MSTRHFLCSAGLFSLAFGARAETMVTMSVGAQPVSIHEIGDIDIVENTFVVDRPLESNFKLRVSGVFEGNLCGANTVAFVKENTIAAVDAYDVYLKSVTFNHLLVESRPCTAESREESFQGVLEFAPTYWNEGQQKRAWRVRIRDGGGTRATLQVTLDRSMGWSVLM